MALTEQLLDCRIKSGNDKGDKTIAPNILM